MATTGENWLQQSLNSSFHKWPYNRLINGHTPVPGFCAHIMLHGKRDFTGVEKVMDLEVRSGLD